MKSILTSLTILMVAHIASAHGLHPTLANYTTTINTVYEYATHTVGYPETEFTNLVGVSSVQDTVRKIRVIKYSFSAANCAKDLEIYTKLDGSAVLSHKVVGCAP